MDANGHPARPASSFTVPPGFTGYTGFRVAADGSFYLSQNTTDSRYLFFHISGVAPTAARPSDPFGDWAQSAGLSGANAAAGADPDGDGRSNLAEFLFGSSPNDKNSSPKFPVKEEFVGNNHHPAVTLLRRSVTGTAQLEVRVSSSLDFADDLGSTVVSTTPLGNGLEQVVIRSNRAANEAPRQFFRFVVHP